VFGGIFTRNEGPPIPTARRHRLAPVIDFGRLLEPSSKVRSYQYSWWAVDAFAMDERQYGYKYPNDRSKLEFTHIIIDDPVENLLLVVQFPEDFRPADLPEIRVTKPDANCRAHEWQRVSDIENELNQTDALRYTKSLNTAALRIRRPQRGYSYGIQWIVPGSRPVASTLDTTRMSR